MYKILYRKHGEKEWQCLGAYTDMMVAVEELDKLERSPLGKDGEFKIAREGSKNGKINNDRC